MILKIILGSITFITLEIIVDVIIFKILDRRKDNEKNKKDN